MQLRDIEYMVCVAETKNFTRAAERLFISQSALSQAMLRLEGELGVKLFNRDPSEISLTYAGQIFYDDSLEVLSRCNRIQAKMSDICNLKKGLLRISVPSNYARLYVTGVIPVFRKLYPGIELELHEAISSHIEDYCRKGKSDFGIVALPLSTDNLKTIPLFDETVYICLPANNPIAVSYLPGEESPAINLSMLRNEHFVLLKGGQRMRDQGMMLCKEAGFRPQIVYEASLVDTVLEFVRNELGIGFITEAIRRHCSEEGVRYFKIMHEERVYTRTMAAIYSENTYLSKAATEFIRLAKNKPMFD